MSAITPALTSTPPTPIQLSVRAWGRLISDKDPDWQLLSYGLAPGSSIVRKLVTRNRASGWVYVAQCAAQFTENTDWEDDTGHLVTLWPAVSRVAYEMPGVAGEAHI